jgi:ligand-binding SRPBCC domain-containing protein
MEYMDSIIVRAASDDFFARITADAMQGMEFVDVISVVPFDGEWRVYAKFNSDRTDTDTIDEAISERLRKS